MSSIFISYMRKSRLIFLISALFLILFLASADNQMLIPLLPALSSDFGVAVEEVAWVFSLYAISASVFNLLLGPLTDRWGRVLFLKLGLIGFSVLAFATYRATTYGDLLWLRAGTGIASGLLSTCTAGLVGDFFPYQRRGRIMGIVLSSYFVALILGLPLGTWIAEGWHWRTVFFCSGMLAAALALVSLGLPRQPDLKQSEGVQFKIYLDFLRERDTRSALVVSFVVAGGTLAFLVFLSNYLHQSFGLSPFEISWIFLTAGIAAFLGSLVSGWVSDRWSKRRVFLVFNSLFALALLGIQQFSWGAALMLVFFFISLCVSFRQTALHTLQTELVTEQRRGAYLALRNSASQLGIAVFVLVAGSLNRQLGFGGVTALVALSAVGTSLLFFKTIREPG